MNLQESLKNLGLNEKEAKVYLALLQLGSTTAYSVALRSGLKKPTTYVILGQLVEKGFAKQIPGAKKQLFSPESPEYIFAMTEERFLHSKEALPELLAMRKQKDQKVSTFYYEGIKGYKEMYYKLINEVGQKEVLGFYAHVEDSPQELIDFWAEINDYQEKIKVNRRVITTHHNMYLENPTLKAMLDSQMVKLKGLGKDKYNSNISLEVYGDYTVIASHRFLQAVVMDNPDVSNVISQIFEIVWELVDKDKDRYIKYTNVRK